MCLHTAGEDYAETTERFTVDPSVVDVVQCFDFPQVFDDELSEGTENVSVTLSLIGDPPSFLTFSRDTANVEISDDEGKHKLYVQLH